MMGLPAPEPAPPPLERRPIRKSYPTLPDEVVIADRGNVMTMRKRQSGPRAAPG